MPSAKPHRAHEPLQETIIVKMVKGLVQSRLTKVINSSGQRRILPGSVEGHLPPTKRVVAQPAAPIGVAAQITLDEAMAAAEAAVDAALAAFGAHPATPQEMADALLRQALKALGITGASGAPAPSPLSRIVLNHDINFDGPVPVGGWTNLSLFPSGNFSFSGHVHDSGAVPYNYGVAWVIRSSVGTAFEFKQAGIVHGSLGSGSTDDDWSLDGSKPVLASAWNDLAAGYSSQIACGVGLDIAALVDAAKQAVGTVGDIITIVG